MAGSCSRIRAPGGDRTSPGCTLVQGIIGTQRVNLLDQMTAEGVIGRHVRTEHAFRFRADRVPGQ